MVKQKDGGKSKPKPKVDNLGNPVKSTTKAPVKPVPKTSVKPAAKPKSGLTADQQARFGVSGPVGSVELDRIKRAISNKGDIESKGGTYFSPYDTSVGGTAGRGASAANRDISGGGAGISGGGAGGNANAGLDAYTRVLQDMFNKQSYAEPYDQLRGQLEGLYGTAQTGLQDQYGTAEAKLKELMGGAGAQINTSMDQLRGVLEAQQNPYQGFVAQQAQAVPGLNELLGSQGVSTDPVARMATALNAGNAGQAAAFQNLGNQMGSIYGANQQGMLGDVAQQRASAQTGLANQGAAYGQQLSGNLTADKNALARQLLGEQSTIAKGSADAQGDMMSRLLAALQAGGSLGKGGLKTPGVSNPSGVGYF